MADILNTIDSEEILNIGEDFSSTFDDVDGWDGDYLKLDNLSASNLYSFTIDAEEYGYLSILDADGNYIWQDVYYDIDDFDTIYFVPQTDGTYFLDVEGENGDYTVKSSQEDLVKDNFADSFDEAYEISLDENGHFSSEAIEEDGINLLQTGDKDYFKVDLTADKIYAINPNNYDVYPIIYDQDGNMMWDNIEWYGDSFIITPTEDMQITIELTSWLAGDNSYTLDVSEIEVGEDDHPNDVSEEFGDDDTISNVSEDGVEVSGELGIYDLDYFKLNVTSDEIYEIQLVSSDENFYAWLDIVDQDGNYLWDNTTWSWSDDISIKDTLYFMPPADGDYFVSVSGGMGEYVLDVKSIEIEADDHANSIDTVTDTDVLSLNTPINASLETAFDKDVYKISLNENNSYDIYLTSDDDNFWPYVEVLDQDGKYQFVDWAWDDDYTTKAHLSFTPETAGDYFIQVDGYSNGDYSLEVVQAGEDDHANSIEMVDENDTLTFDNSVALSSGRLETSGDTDIFKVDLDSQKVYEIKLTSDSDNFYPYVDVTDENGNWVDVNWNYNPDAITDLIITPSQDGSYYIEISGFDRGDYKIEVDEINIEADDHANSIDTVSDNDVIELDTEITADLETSIDKDYFKFSATAGETYQIILDGNTHYPWIDLYDQDQNMLWDAYYSYSDTDTIVTFTAQQTGDIYIGISDYEAVEDYSLKVVKASDSDDHPNSVYANFDTTYTFDEKTTLTGSLETTYDQDYFKFSANSGDVIDIVLSSDEQDFYGYMDILDNEGNYEWNNVNYVWSLDENQIDHLIFTATQEGDYFIDVSGYQTGDYSITAQKLSLEADDHANSIDAVSENDILTDSITASLETPIDTDYYKIDVTAGEVYTINVNSIDINLDLYDINENYLWQNTFWDWIENGESITYIADQDETIYLKVSGYSAVDSYELDLVTSTIAEDDYVNTITEAQTLDSIATDGSVISGKVDSSYDTDVFKLSMNAGNTYVVELTSDVWPWLDVLDENGNYVWQDISWQWDDEDVAKLVITPSSDETYYLNVSGYEVGEYQLKVTDTETTPISDDYSADSNTTGSVDVGNTTTGELETLNDIDWIKVSLEAGKVYQIDAMSDIVDVMIDGVYDENGKYIDNTWDDDSGAGLNAQSFIKADYTGDYYIAIDGYNIGSYDVKINEITLSDNEVDNVNTKASVKVDNAPYIGNVDYAKDEDWVKVTLSANTTYQIDLKGDTLSDTVINGIYDANGKLISNTFNDDNGFSLDSQVVFTAKNDGDYYISVGGYDSNTGSYNLFVSTADSTTVQKDTQDNDINNTIDTAINLDLGVYADGVIDYSGDTDMFKVTLDAGKTYDISMLGDSSDNGSLIDPDIIGLYDADGNEIDLDYITADDAGIGFDSYLTFTPSESGDYYIKAASYDDLVGTYKVQVKQEVQIDEVTPVSTHAEDGDGSWTIMIYLAADNNLEEAALKDLNEMEAANLPDNVHVTFLIDRAEGYSTADGDWTTTKQGIITHDEDMNSIASPMEDLGELNTGDGETLTNFINWSTSVAQADNYALVVWDHGGGIAGTSWDEASNYDNLSIDELTTAINNSNVNNFDMIGFDTCLQGVLDQSYALKDNTDVVVASENTEPGDGWDYTGWLNSLNEDIDGITSEEMAEYAVESYADFYDGMDGTTLSAIRTDKIDDLTSALKDFNDAISLLTDSEKSEFKAKIDTVKHYDIFNDYVDLASLATMADGIDATTNSDADGKTFDDYAQELYSVIKSDDDNDAIISAYSDDSQGEGVTIYLPGWEDTNYLENYKLAQETDMDNLFNLVS